MKRFLTILITLCLIGGVFFSCKEKKDASKQPKEPAILTFNPEDSIQVDQLMRFYIENEIIPKEALACKHDSVNGLHTFDCLCEDCFITNDFIDSNSQTFFVELDFDSGSSGNNGIYICQRNENGFKILFSTEGSIDQDLGPECKENGYNVLYIQSQDHVSRLFYNGKQFVREDLKKDPDVVVQK